MKRIFLLCLAAGLALSACSKGYDIYLCIGQSNMAGRGDMLPEDTLALPGVWILDYDDVPVPAKAPLNRYSTIRKIIDIQGINPAWSFASTMRAATRRDILLVVNAKGGTPLDLWVKGAPGDTLHAANDRFPDRKVTPPFYDEAVRRTKAAMRYGTLKGILWHQGEGDSHLQERRDSYLDKLEKMVRDLREDLGADVPFVAGEVARDGLGKEINPVLDSIPLRIPRSACVSAEGLATRPDNVHFDRASQIRLGERYAEAMQALLKTRQRCARN